MFRDVFALPTVVSFLCALNLLGLSGCTKKSDSQLAQSGQSLDVAQVESHRPVAPNAQEALQANPQSQTQPPPPPQQQDAFTAPAAASKPTQEEALCEKDWKPAAEAFETLVGTPDAAKFKMLVEKIPKFRKPQGGDEEGVRCASQTVILQGLDTRFKDLESWSKSDAVFARFVAKIQQISDGAIAESLCEAGSRILAKDPEMFVRVLTEERENVRHVDCFATWAMDMVDQSKAKRSAFFNTRVKKLEAIKDPRLKAVRDEMVKAIKHEK